jgi:hypothetical protein
MDEKHSGIAANLKASQRADRHDRSFHCTPVRPQGLDHFAAGWRRSTLQIH